MHVVLCNFVTCVRPSPQTRYRGVCKDPVWLFLPHPSPPAPLHPTLPNTWIYSSVFHLYNSFVSGMLHTWNDAVWKPLTVVFCFFSHSASFPKDSYKQMQVSRVCFALFLINFCGMDDAS